MYTRERANAWEYLFKRKIVMTVTLSATVHTPLAIRMSACVRVYCVCVRALTTYVGVSRE